MQVTPLRRPLLPTAAALFVMTTLSHQRAKLRRCRFTHAAAVRTPTFVDYVFAGGTHT